MAGGFAGLAGVPGGYTSGVADWQKIQEQESEQQAMAAFGRAFRMPGAFGGAPLAAPGMPPPAGPPGGGPPTSPGGPQPMMGGPPQGAPQMAVAPAPCLPSRSQVARPPAWSTRAASVAKRRT